MKCFTKVFMTAALLVAGLVTTAFIPAPSRPQAKVAIFDFHGVIFDVNKGKVARKHLGIGTILRYVFSGNSPMNMYKKALSLLFDMRKEPFVTEKANWPTMHGQPMPQAVVDWQLGTKSEAEIRAEINEFLKTHPDYFKSKTERKLVIRVLQMMFSAQKRLEFTEPVKEGLALVRWYKAAGYEVYALTNNDHVTMGLLHKQYPEILGLFDHIFYSADLKLMKPYASCFEYILRTKGVCAQQCRFFDDQCENTEAFRKLGGKVLLCTRKSMKNLHKALVTSAKQHSSAAAHHGTLLAA